MTGDLTNVGENKALGALTEKPWLKLHTGDPGEEGTANAAAETTRKQITLGAASAGKRSSTTEAKWEGVSTTEKYVWVSAWTASIAGECEWKALIPAGGKNVEAGDTFILAAGKVSIAND